MLSVVGLTIRKISVTLSVAIALWLTGCFTAPPGGSAPDSASSPQAAQPDLLPSTATTAGDADPRDAVQRAVLADPIINAIWERENNRVAGRAESSHSLQVRAIAIVEPYALAEWFAGAGDLPIDGYALLIQQQGQWMVLEDSVGIGPGDISPDRMADLGISSDAIIQDLLAELRAAGADFQVVDTPVYEEPIACTTLTTDPNPPTNVRIRPVVEAGTIVGQLPDGTAVTVNESLVDWLKIHQPVVGWVSLNLTRVSCGNSIVEVQENLNHLQSIAEERSVDAADVLVRYLYRGADGAFADAAIATFNQFASDRFYALDAAMANHSEAVRRTVLQQVIKAGLLPRSRSNFEQAAQNYQEGQFRSPTLETWQVLNQN